MKGLRPFFSFYGGKWRAAKYYPEPKYPDIVEPFAGSAGYSLRYPDRNVTLVDVDPKIAGVWRYLIQATPEQILDLPDVTTTTDDLDVPKEAKWLIGFWLNKGSSTPAKSPSAWMRAGNHDTSFWGQAIRERIASQVDSIKHWTIIEGDYEQSPNLNATWFIDPPYETPAGRHYKANEIHYGMLARWVLTRKGQIIVAEQEGSDWLPFEPFREVKSNESKYGGKVSKEVIWTNDLDMKRFK